MNGGLLFSSRTVFLFIIFIHERAEHQEGIDVIKSGNCQKRHKKAFLRYKREVQCISYQPTIEGGRDQRAEMVKDLKQYTPESPRDPVSAFQHLRSSIFLTFLAGRHLRQAVIKKERRQALPYCLQEMMCGLQWTARGVTEEHKRLKVCVERIKPV